MSATLERPILVEHEELPELLASIEARQPAEPELEVIPLRDPPPFANIVFEGCVVIAPEAKPEPKPRENHDALVREIANIAYHAHFVPVPGERQRTLYDRLVEYHQGNVERARAEWRHLTCCTGMARGEFIGR